MREKDEREENRMGLRKRERGNMTQGDRDGVTRECLSRADQTGSLLQR
jgi:hypothetical protein